MTRMFLLLGLTLVWMGACTPETSTAPELPASAAEKLDRIDLRTPLPLPPMMAKRQKENMRDHLLVVKEIIGALVSDDFATIERAAQRIGFSEGTRQMCTRMGAAAPGFTEQALAFHQRVDRVAAAAREGDRVGVLEQLGATLEICTACHATWKQQVVDEATWERLASTGPSSQEKQH
ncbi:MAG: cytochrome c [Deltaproteobacteria bacterium]|nr:cytochrome c [Deltaproteobacteria bacterium]MBW2577263.1 cytochrome c [Deltaproteobacteria bacterium]MBW2694105.1 cytochrome c [Deltaproteobacteria bacterium]